MGFFEPPPRPPEPSEEHVRPEWWGGPENELPASFPLEQMLVRSDSIAMRLHAGRAYSNGFEFVLAVRRRGEDGIPNHPLGGWHQAIGATELPDDLLRFGVEFADGRKVNVFDRFRLHGTRERPEIFLSFHGSGGSARMSDLSFWVWPLPPEGPVTFVVEWPSEGVALTRAEIDSAPIRAAAAHVDVLWP